MNIFRACISLLFCMIICVLFTLSLEAQDINCTDCHADKLANSTVHMPAENCALCHEGNQQEHPGESLVLAEEVPKLCYNCHENQEKGLSVHFPVETGECLTCHNPHSSNYKALLTEKTPDLCFMCHEGADAAQNSKSMHTVYTDKKNCSNCHSPHATNNSGILLKAGKDLCFSCHNKTIKTEEKTIENIAQKFNRSKSQHAAVDMGGCTVCHTPHYSEFPLLLNATFPEKRYANGLPENFQACFTCHDSGLMTEEFTESATNFRDGEQNMHFVHLEGKKARNCNLCHDMHASRQENLIKPTVKFGDFEMNMNYKKTETGGGSCLPACHGELSYTP